MAEMKVVITKIGLTKITEATIDNPLKLTHFSVGDGNGAEIDPNEDMTSLVNEKYRDVLNDTYTNENNLTIECVLRANAPITTGFKIFELGIFDADGDMIAISQTPEQYRPAPSEGVTTEWIASVVLQLSNTENITIEIPETVYATVDALQRLTDTVNELITSRNNFINSCVGIEKHFNTDNRYKDQDILKIGIKTYGLAGSIVKIADYPTAFKNCGAVDRGDGTFEIPKFHDGTIRHLPKGSARELGSYEADDFKGHLHTTPDHLHSIPAKNFWFRIRGIFESGNSSLIVSQDGLSVSNDANDYKSMSTNQGPTYKYSYTSVTQTNSGGAGNTSSVGGAETRMKNTAGQWYMLLKINI